MGDGGAWIGAIGHGGWGAAASAVGVAGVLFAASVHAPTEERAARETALETIRGAWVGVDGSYDGATLLVAGPRRRPSATLCAPVCVDIGAEIEAVEDGVIIARYVETATGAQRVARIEASEERLTVIVPEGVAQGVHIFESR